VASESGEAVDVDGVELTKVGALSETSSLNARYSEIVAE
jgi:hypothetical protein